MIWRPNVTVAAVITRNDRYLLVEEEIEGRRVFNQPAGHLEQGESLLDGVAREVREETACQFVPDALVAVQLWNHPQRDLTFLRFAFSGRMISQDPGRELDDDIIATHWLRRSDIEELSEQLRSPLVWQTILAYEKGQRFPLSVLQTFL